MEVQIFRIQILAVVGSLLVLGGVLRLLKHKKLKEEYALLWLGIATSFLTLSLWRDLLTRISYAIGIAYPPAALFLILIMGAYLLLLHYSLVMTKLAEKNRDLAQELGLLRVELERLQQAPAVRASMEEEHRTHAT
ncbi:hypothetical protein D3C87_1590310 [compost metagenome]